MGKNNSDLESSVGISKGTVVSVSMEVAEHSKERTWARGTWKDICSRRNNKNRIERPGYVGLLWPFK